nr:hypothetical protein [Burkholderia glumae]
MQSLSTRRRAWSRCAGVALTAALTECGGAALAFAVPSYLSLTMGPGPVSFASLLLGADGSNQVSVAEQRTGSGTGYDCSSAFVDFPAANAPISIH